MNKILSLLVITLFTASVNAQTDANLGIIPAPVSVKKNTGFFNLDKTVVLVANTTEAAKMANLLNTFVRYKAGFALRDAKAVSGKTIELTEKDADKLPTEGYTIKVTDKKITLVGKGAGLFYAVQSLMQMMPEKGMTKIVGGDAIKIQTAEINDYPRFKYRGMHLDVGRHFFPLSFVKKYIDLLAQYKINSFHWHLTEDQGWRIEIKKYPKLTSVGAYRNGTVIGHHPGVGTDDKKYGGFYTQEEAKEIVRYAAERYITVIPEIEMPGHSSAAIAAYPELSCFPDKDTVVPKGVEWSGSSKGKYVQQAWGIYEDVFVPTETTFKFLENVLDEVIAIFPSKYIHIGGDECPKGYWKQSEFCQKLMKEKGLKDEHELQSYFIQRIEKHINSKGRSIIGWDEILEGGLAPNATVMSWRGEAGGIAAAKDKHNVIMTPGSGGLYFDHKQSNSVDEPTTIGGFAPYAKAYSYNPVPKELTVDEQKYVIGVQANVWTEYMESPEKVEYMILPRLYALAEIAWTPLDKKDFKNFSEERLPLHLARVDKTNTNYWVPTPIGQNEKVLTGENFNLELKAPLKGAKIYYTLDNSRPSENATLYTDNIKVQVRKGKKLVLKTVVIAPSGKRSVVNQTILNNGADDVKVN